VQVYVKTPSRLHFALIDLNGELGRVDGSLGLSLDFPNLALNAQPHDKLEIIGEQAEQFRKFALQFLSHFQIGGGVQIQIESAIPQHVGLGSGTQSSLAIAAALAEIFGIEGTVRAYAKVMGRGSTSGVGVAAFEGGGLVLDGGHSFGENREKQGFLPSHISKASPAPLLARYSLPKDWMFVLAIPNVLRKVFGEEEARIFRERCPIHSSEVEKVCRTILMKILPAVIEQNIVEFGAGLNELQRSGFAHVTLDLMHPTVKSCIQFLNDQDALGAGQSSFGPTCFGLVQGENKAATLAKAVEDFLSNKGGGRVFYTAANNIGAIIRVSP